MGKSIILLLVLTCFQSVIANAQISLKLSDVFQAGRNYNYSYRNLDSTNSNQFKSLPLGGSGKVWDYSGVSVNGRDTVEYRLAQAPFVPGASHQLVEYSGNSKYVVDYEINSSGIYNWGQYFSRPSPSDYQKKLKLIEFPLTATTSFIDTSLRRIHTDIFYSAIKSDVIGSGSLKTIDSTYTNCLLVKEITYYESGMPDSRKDTVFVFYCSGIGASVLEHKRIRHKRGWLGSQDVSYTESISLLDKKSLTKPVGLRQTSSNVSINLFPNPVQRGEKVEIEGVENSKSIIIRDSRGQVVEVYYEYTNSQFNISTSGLSSGIYSLEIQTRNATKLVKLIVN